MLPFAAVIATVAFTKIPCAHAADWRFTPGITLRETYTDNVDLAPPETAQEDFVTEINPQIVVTGRGQHLDFNGRYVMQNLYYARKNEHRILNTLDADGKAELVDELFFVDGRATVNQATTSAFGARPVDNLNTSADRTNVRNYSLSPYLRHRFDTTALSELRYTHAALNTGSDNLADAKADQIRIRVVNGPAFRDIGWGAQYIDQRIRYVGQADFDLRKIMFNGRYLLSPTFGLTAGIGHEKYNYVSLGEKPDGYFWSLGIAWAPLERTNVEASVGRRFYGNSYAATANHRTRATVWNFTYNEDLTTTQENYLLPTGVETSSFLDQLLTGSISDPVARQQAVDTFVRNTDLPGRLSQDVIAFSNRVVLQKRAQASFAITGARNTVIFTLRNTKREPQSAIVPGVSAAATAEDDLRQTGAFLVFNRRIAPRTNSSISTEYLKSTSPVTNRRDHETTVRLAVATQFQPRLSGRLEVRRVLHSSNLVGQDFRENAIAVSLFASF